MQGSGHQLAFAAALLAQGRLIDRMSFALSALAAFVLIGAARWPTSPEAILGSIVLLAGLGELYLAVRVRLDAELFRGLAEDAAAGRLDLSSFDAALTGLGVLSDEKAGRPIPERYRGARRLMIGQALLLAVQVGTIVLGAVLLPNLPALYPQ